MDRFRSVLAGVIAVTVVAGFLRVNTMAAASDPKSPSVPPDALATIATLRAEVNALRDREMIHEVYVHYGRGIDRLDEQAYKSAFWPDAQINYGTAESITPQQHWDEHMIQGHKAKLETWAHLLTNETVEINGDVAHAEIYVTRLAVPKDRNDKDRSTVWSGRYIDRLDRRNGEWRIAVREFVPDFSMKVDINYHEAWDPLYEGDKSTCLRQAFARHDTSYVRPLNRRTDTAAGPPCAK